MTEKKISSYRDLKVWQRTMDLAVDCYKIVGNFPSHEVYGLASQLRRSASSIPANIAEGHARSHTKEFIRYLTIARGSIAETETHLILSRRLAYVTGKTLDDLLKRTKEVGKRINGLLGSLERRIAA